MSSKSERIGIFDWGIGGLSVYGRIKRAQPQLSILYLSDAGYTAYGKMPRIKLIHRVHQVLHFFYKRGIRRVVVGCNAASSVLEELPFSPWLHKMRISGVVECGVLATLEGTSGKRIGVLGGRRTIQSQCYRRPLLAAGFTVKQRIAQALSGLIEKGDTHSPRLRRKIRSILMPLIRDGVDVLILGCTHYPAILTIFQEYLPGVTVIDPGEIAAQKLILDLQQEEEPLQAQAKTDIFLTTGNPLQMANSAQNAFSVRLVGIQSIPKTLYQK